MDRIDTSRPSEDGPESEETPGLRYDAAVDLENRNSSHTQLVLLTGRDRRVLEVGPANGGVTRELQRRGCRVTGIEIDPDAAAMAAPFCERMIVGDIQDLDLSTTLGTEKYDAVIFGDVLEHLIEPRDVLERVRPFLAAEGRVLASIPNVAHASVRLALLLGRFRYTERGLLDSTHLRFFTQESVRELFEDAGYEITTWSRITLEPFDTEIAIQEKELPTSVVESVRGEPEALTYQFIVEARPGGDRQRTEATASPPSRALGLLWDSSNRDEELHRRLADARATLSVREAQISEKDAAIERRDAELEALRASRAVRLALALSRFLRPLRRRSGPPRGSS